MTTNIATFGGGCFWCTEAVFLRLRGVEKVVSGYMGGSTDNPTYTDICTGTTGHAEVIQVHFDPDEISFADLLEVFFATHDPTTLNRQGNDAGTQYRSAVFFHDEHQQQLAIDAIKALDDASEFSSPIVTEVSPASEFYPAEDYHQNYFALNPAQPYCNAVVGPKVQKFIRKFESRVKDS